MDEASRKNASKSTACGAPWTSESARANDARVVAMCSFIGTIGPVRSMTDCNSAFTSSECPRSTPRKPRFRLDRPPERNVAALKLLIVSRSSPAKYLDALPRVSPVPGREVADM